MKTPKPPKSNRNAPNLPDMPKVIGRAYRYYLMGLNAKEIAKLLDISSRTLQRWKKEYNFELMEKIPDTKTETIQQKAYKMANAGLYYSQIAKKLKRCKGTIYNYIKAEKAKILENTE